MRIDDPGQLLDKHEGKTPRARLLIGLGSPGFVFRLLPVVSKDSGGRRHEIAVPFDTPLTLVIRNSYFQVDDEAGARLSSSQARVIPLTVRPGQQVATVKLTVKGAGT